MTDHGLTHLDPLGRARMVDVTPKEASHRRAIAKARVHMQTETASLVARGRQRMAQKIGEEGVETALALTGGDRDAVLDESADLLFHLMVALISEGLSLTQVIARLESRHRG